MVFPVIGLHNVEKREVTRGAPPIIEVRTLNPLERKNQRKQNVAPAKDQMEINYVFLAVKSNNMKL